MRGPFLAIQCLDGFETTRDNVAGRLVALFDQGGLVDMAEQRTFSTIYGTIALSQTARPGG